MNDVENGLEAFDFVRRGDRPVAPYIACWLGRPCMPSSRRVQFWLAAGRLWCWTRFLGTAP